MIWEQIGPKYARTRIFNANTRTRERQNRQTAYAKTRFGVKMPKRVLASRISKPLFTHLFPKHEGTGILALRVFVLVVPCFRVRVAAFSRSRVLAVFFATRHEKLTRPLKNDATRKINATRHGKTTRHEQHQRDQPDTPNANNPTTQRPEPRSHYY